MNAYIVLEHKLIIVNIICSLLLQVVTIVSGFILPKIIISSLGSETNGLVASINQFLNYVVLLEGGVSGVITASLYQPLSTNGKLDDPVCGQVSGNPL